MSILTGQTPVPAGTRASWQVNAPAGLSIIAVTIASGQMYSIHINDGQSWGGGFYWQGGGSPTNDSTTAFGSFMNSPYFGFQIVCGWSSCNGSTHPAQLTVESMNLVAQETQSPWLVSPDGLWQAPGWVRGDWALHFYGDSPTGLCSLSATLDGQPIPGTSSTVNPATWHQCAAPAVSQSLQTGSFGSGAVPLTLSATDAAGVPVSVTKTIYIDNTQPAVSFSGPTDAPSTAGTQYVTATAGGSPSGIDGLACSVDGSPNQWYAGSSAQVPVSGIGGHTVRCAAANNATDEAGNRGWSSWATWSLSIREPTLSGIGFPKLVDALHCRRVHVLKSTRGHWVRRRRGRRIVRVWVPPRSKLVTLTRCHPKIVRRKISVWVTVHRRGRAVRVKRVRYIRVVELPHTIMRTVERIPYGRSTTVSGWLGTSDGTALPSQTVDILTAPDNDSGVFGLAAVALTASSGGWSATLPAGPSRLVEAVYAGSGTLEPSSSAQIRVVVPARVRLISIWPRRVAWGGRVRIVGQLLGGYLPPGGALVRLRIGYGGAYTTYGVQEHVTGDGRFSTTYTFGLGDPSIIRAYWFQIASLPMGNYPFEPAASAKLTVVVGGHPHVGPPPTHRRHRRRRHRR